MKKIFFATSLTLSLVLCSVAVFAQTENYPTPKWVSEKGYWMIETNIHTPKLNTIYFYNNDKILVYEEKLDGILINIKKRNMKMKLKNALDQSVTAFDQKQKKGENKMMVMNLIKKH